MCVYVHAFNDCSIFAICLMVNLIFFIGCYKISSYDNIKKVDENCNNMLVPPYESEYRVKV